MSTMFDYITCLTQQDLLVQMARLESTWYLELLALISSRLDWQADLR